MILVSISVNSCFNQIDSNAAKPEQCLSYAVVFNIDLNYYKASGSLPKAANFKIPTVLQGSFVR